ncbi:hypothetical protein [Allofournierella sp.]|uniref:hypothetical protein n=1 Tax=Allofournierella sp. TaxID=1940256 RepID=UPI003AB6B9DC
MGWFEPRTPVYAGEGDELQKVMKLLKDHSIDYKTQVGAAGTLVLVKRSLADEAEMQIREAKARNWLW